MGANKDSDYRLRAGNVRSVVNAVVKLVITGLPVIPMLSLKRMPYFTRRRGGWDYYGRSAERGLIGPSAVYRGKATFLAYVSGCRSFSAGRKRAAGTIAWIFSGDVRRYHRIKTPHMVGTRSNKDSAPIFTAFPIIRLLLRSQLLWRPGI